MIVRELKLKLTKKQEATLEEWLWMLTGLHNWATKKLGADANDGRYYSKFDVGYLIKGHAKRVGLPAQVALLAIQNVWLSWQRCFKRLSKRPRLKGKRNPLTTIAFYQRVGVRERDIRLTGLGYVRFHKQSLPEGKVKIARIIKRATGWYCLLTIDTVHKIEVKETTEAVGIDPGFSTLLTLSNGEKIENPRELRKGERRIGQAQRGRNKQLTARLRERQANRRKDRNHKISTKLIQNFQTIYISKDNRRAMARTKFGKSVSEAALSQLFCYLKYKGAVQADRRVVEVSNVNSTRRCCNCGSLSGPTGRSALKVRQWECVCGAILDRDINAAMNTLATGLGLSLNAERQLTETATPQRSKGRDEALRSLHNTTPETTA